MSSAVGILMRKEFAELRRDRRVLFMTVIMPVLLYPAMIGGMNRMESRRSEDLQIQTFVVGIAGGAPELRAVLEQDSTLQFFDSDQDLVAASVNAGALTLGVFLPEHLSGPGADAPDTVTIVARFTREDAREARRRIEAGLQTWVTQSREQRWLAAGGSGRPEDLLAFVSHDVSTAEEAGGA